MDIKDLKVLVSDDSMLARKKTVDCINAAGCTNIFEAINGQEAVDMYKQHKPDIVFMDIVMPVKTGLEALVEILEYNSEAIVIIASSTGTQSHLKTAIDAGATDFIQKPIDPEHIKRTLSKVSKGVE